MIRLFKHYIPHAVLLLGLFDLVLLVGASEFAWRLRASQIGMDTGLIQDRIWQHACFAGVMLIAMIAVGVFGADARKCSEALMERGLVHFLASDAHDLDRRSPRLDHVRAHVAERYGAEYGEALLEAHPRAVIEGRALHPGALEPPDKKKRWFSFWR